jgi:glycine/D-amino acid oxidase-like deaminating enzyme
LKSSVAVIGRGLAGLEIARRLLDQNFEVTLFGEADPLDAASWAAQGSSILKGNHIARSFLFKEKVEGHYRLCRWLKEISNRSGFNIRIGKCGYEVYSNQQEFQSRLYRAHHGHSLALKRTGILSYEQFPEHLIATVSHVRNSALGALAYPDDFHFSVEDLRRALESIVLPRSQLVEQKVDGLKINKDDIQILPAPPSKSNFRKVIVAAGPGSPNLLPMLDKRKFVPVGGHTMSFAVEIGFDSLLVEEKHVLSVLNGTGSYGASSVNINTVCISDWQENSRSSLMADFFKYFPKLNPIDIEDAANFRCGIRLRTANRCPVAGRIPLADSKAELYLITGLHKNGYQLVHSCADLIIDEISAKAQSWEHPYSPLKLMS